MKLEEAMRELEALGDEKVRNRNVRNGASGPQFGVKSGDVRKLAKKCKTDHALALQLWETGNLDARMLAILVAKVKSFGEDELDRLVRTLTTAQVAVWFNSYIVKKHPAKESLRQRWMTATDPWAARAGWFLTAERVAKKPEGLDLVALLDRIEEELPEAAPAAQWTMNSCLVEIGIHHPEHRARAIAIGERHGVYRDYPTSKGCTSPFAPIWIEAMVARQR